MNTMEPLFWGQPPFIGIVDSLSSGVDINTFRLIFTLTSDLSKGLASVKVASQKGSICKGTRSKIRYLDIKDSMSFPGVLLNRDNIWYCEPFYV